MSDIVWPVGEQLAEQPIEQSWHPRLGWATTRSWRGLDGYVRGQIPYFLAAGIQFSYVPEDGPYSVIRAFLNSAADGSPPANQLLVVWSKKCNDIEKSIYSHPNAQALGGYVLDTIQGAVDDTSRTYQERVAIIRAAAIASNVSPDQAQLMFTDILQGQEIFTFEQHVLMRNVIASEQQDMTPYEANVGRMFSSATIAATELPPTNLFNALPTGYWLKKGAIESQMSDGRWQVFNEWWFTDGTFSRFTYGNPL